MVKEKLTIEQYIDAIELDVSATYSKIHKEQRIVKATADIIFKYMTSQDSRLSQYFRNTIIEEATGLSIQSTRVLNTEILPEEVSKKKMVVDVLLEDVSKNLFNLEMQSTQMRKETWLRFQEYACRLASNKLIHGDTYDEVRPIFQIVFVNYEPSGYFGLMQSFELRDEKNSEIKPYSVVRIIYIYMPYIHKIAEMKTFEEMRAIEKICYLYTNEINSSIIKSKERVVKAFLTQLMEIRNNENIWDRISIECHERAERTERLLEKRDEERRLQREKESMRKALEKGIKEGIKEGKKEGKKEGIIEGMQEGAIKERMYNLHTLFLLKYERDEMMWLKGLDMIQLNQAMQLLLSCDTFEELKEKVEKTLTDK